MSIEEELRKQIDVLERLVECQKKYIAILEASKPYTPQKPITYPMHPWYTEWSEWTRDNAKFFTTIISETE